MTTSVYRLLVATARRATDLLADPVAGDLVVETSGILRRPVDPDAIGWLLGHGQAAYAEDGTGPTRDVWDVLPLNPDAKLQTIGGERFQRWENARFGKVPDEVLRAAGIESPLSEGERREP